MGDSSRYFGMDRGGSPSSHWMPAEGASFQAPNSLILDDASFDYSLSPNIEQDSMDHDPSYAKRVMEFETTVQEKLQEELREEEILFVQKWTNTGLQVVALITEHLVSHPFIVLRRQCQVNHRLMRYHLIPVSLASVVINIHRWQGLTCLWKGVGSVLVIKGLTLAVQDLLSKVTLWPKEINLDSPGKHVGKHVMLKCVTYAIITPFYSASLLETVQSEIASEKPEFLDVFKEGFRRLLCFGVHQKGRMLPVWSLIVPTAMYFILKHFLSLILKTVISRMLILNQDKQHRKQGAIPKDFELKDGKNIELTSSVVAVLSADMILYPMETVLHRLHLQGTRTIIDNLDNGLSVIPILTNFESVADCYESTVREEGLSGLYKGFGTLVLQCLAYTSIIKLSRFVFTQVSTLFFKSDGSSYPIVGGSGTAAEVPHEVRGPPLTSPRAPPPQPPGFSLRKPAKMTKISVPLDRELLSDSDGFGSSRFNY